MGTDDNLKYRVENQERNQTLEKRKNWIGTEWEWNWIENGTEWIKSEWKSVDEEGEDWRIRNNDNESKYQKLIHHKKMGMK